MLGRYVRGLGALGMLMGLGLLAASCGSGEVAYDTGYPGAPCDSGFAFCDDDSNCWGDPVYEPGTKCIDSRCQCPVDGHVICNARGHTIENNERGCRAPIDCEPGEVCQPAEPPPPPPPEPECTATDLSKCPAPPDGRCGSATCTDGVCGLTITTGPVASQRAGDCKRSVCTSVGLVVEEEDLSDYYDDGLECTFDYCNSQDVQNALMHAISCPETGEGYCSDVEGSCVQCVADVDCNSTEDCSFGRCVPKACSNNQVDPPESDEDCGGKCLPCASGKTCMVNSDCKSNVCTNSQCQQPSCVDKEQNDGETDIDCGAACKDLAKLCGDGQGCKVGADCSSDVCWAGKCQPATCTDGTQNGEETGIDCGGNCPAC